MTIDLKDPDLAREQGRTPTCDRALVHYRRASRASELSTFLGNEGGSEDFPLNPPTNSVAEVERQWQARNPGKTFMDADLVPRWAAPPAPPPAPPIDSQIVRERARGREPLPGTVTPDSDAPLPPPAVGRSNP